MTVQKKIELKKVCAKPDTALICASKSTQSEDFYNGFQCKLYLVTFLTLTNAFSYGHAISIGSVLDPDLILDFARYEQRDFFFAMTIYLGMGQIAGASLASTYCQSFPKYMI